MSDKILDKPAFPNNLSDGMTLREYYAGLAMQGILANPQPYKTRLKEKMQGFYGALTIEKIIADAAVDMADALITALAEREKNHE